MSLNLKVLYDFENANTAIPARNSKVLLEVYYIVIIVTCCPSTA